MIVTIIIVMITVIIAIIVILIFLRFVTAEAGHPCPALGLPWSITCVLATKISVFPKGFGVLIMSILKFRVLY